MPFVYYDAKETSMNPPATIAEEYIPLWVYSSGNINTTSTTAGVGSNAFCGKGSSSAVAWGSQSQISLHTLNTKWPNGQKFAFEASITVGNTNTGYAALYDITAGAVVSASQISTAAATMTVIRSGAFTLTTGHAYGVAIWTSNSANQSFITKAHLVALGG